MREWRRSVRLAFAVTTGLEATFCADLARAEGETSAVSSEIVIWYRASEACPSGTDFASRVRLDGHTARLARAGDHIDYVVTLDSDGKNSSGRLERQSARGTIAISELRGGSCGEVAEALALSLALAVTPRGPSNPAPEAPPEADPPPSETAGGEPREPRNAPSPGAAAAGSDAGRPSNPTSAAAVRSEPREAVPAGGAPASGPRFWIGGGPNGAVGLTTSASAGGKLFVEYEWAAFSAVRPSSLRLGPSFRYSRTSIDGFGRVEHWVPTLGLEFCPLRFSGKTFAFAPCVAGEGGLFVARSERETALTSANVWAALGPAVRGFARLGRRVSLGLTYAVMAPFSRPEVTAGSEVLYRVPPVMLSLGVDVSWAVQ